MNTVRVRVAVYVTRGNDLLVFDHVDVPEAGPQVPAGGVEPGERLEDAAIREVTEETGLGPVTMLGSLGVQRRRADTGVELVTIFYLATTTDSRDRWSHVVGANTGEDAGLRFSCYFLPIADCVGLLAGRQDEFLPQLRR